MLMAKADRSESNVLSDEVPARMLRRDLLLRSGTGEQRLNSLDVCESASRAGCGSTVVAMRRRAEPSA